MELGRIYKKSNETSYALGASLTYELLNNKTKYVKHIYFHPDFENSELKEEFIKKCVDNHIQYSINEKIFKRLSDKEKCTVIGEFEKYENNIEMNKNHLVLVNPMNMGNLGTIIRTMLGFNISDLVIIKPACDIFDPKVIRASMGAIFSIRFSLFDSFEEYQKTNSKNLYTFRLNASTSLNEIQKKDNYALIFGNESSGLPKEFDSIGQGVIINHSDKIDSFSLPMAVGIGLYEFSKE